MGHVTHYGTRDPTNSVTALKDFTFFILPFNELSMMAVTLCNFEK